MNFHETGADSEESTDDDLISRVLGGDKDSFGVLMSRHQQNIYRIVRAIVRNEMEADLITQDVFVQGYLRLASFQKRSEFRTWLSRIAINRSRDLLRSQKRSAQLIAPNPAVDDGFVPADSGPDPQRNLLSGELGKAIENAVESLSPQQKAVFRLRHYDELSLEEIATILGMKAVTARAHLFRGVHKVRSQLSGWIGTSQLEKTRETL